MLPGFMVSEKGVSVFSLKIITYTYYNIFNAH